VVSLDLSEAMYKQLDAGGLEEGSRAVPLLLRDFPGRLSLPSLRTRWEGSRLGQRCARPTPGMHKAFCVRCARNSSVPPCVMVSIQPGSHVALCPCCALTEYCICSLAHACPAHLHGEYPPCAQDRHLVISSSIRALAGRLLVAEGEDALYVAFMGTKQRRDVLTNADARQVPLWPSDEASCAQVAPSRPAHSSHEAATWSIREC
jgi:hypothetical protein